MRIFLAVAFAVHTIGWQDLTAPAQRLWSEMSSGVSFEKTIVGIRNRNMARLQEGEIDHLIFYMLLNRDFTSVPAIDPARAAIRPDEVSARLAERRRDLLQSLAHPSGERQRYLAALLPRQERESFIRGELERVLKWIAEKEEGCHSAASPQTCIAELYTKRGHSSDTSEESTIAIRAAFDWLGDRRRGEFQRILVIGPGSDFAPRTGSRSGPVQVYQPRLLRKLFRQPVIIDCVDLNPRVLAAAAGECDSAERLDVAIERADRTYDAIVATNVLLYLNSSELLPAMSNIRAMLRPAGVFIHNDGRFEAGLFGKASGLPVLHFGNVNLDASRRPPVVDRFVIHSPAPPKL